MTEIIIETTAQDIASRTILVTIPLERLAQTERKATREYTRQVRLPGYRKGHAPEPVVKKKFGTEIRRYILEESLRDGWRQILDAGELKPTAEPQVTNITFEDGQPLVFEMLVEVRPQLTLETTGGFTFTRKVEAVTETKIQDQLDKLREDRATWQPVEGVQPTVGHLVTVSVKTLEDGKEQVAAQPYSLVLGKEQAIPDIEEMIMGLLPEGSAEREVSFPDDHPDPARRGETRRVEVTLHEVKEQILPAVDEHFAAEVGEFASVEALRAAIQADLEGEAIRAADAEVRHQAIERLVEANAVPAPPSLVNRLMQSYAQAYQIPADQMGGFAGSFQPVAEMQVRRELVLDAVATAQNLHATEADLDERIARMAAERGMESGALWAQLEQAKRLGDLERQVTEEKTFAWLLEQSTVTEGEA